ncbi:MAG TPA: ANTAR domain-containing protein [Tepidisphaeraceae bacterium]|nr:ANTAR domain-containing protein [Tepidisphaeraceae bacterium]
MTSANRGGSAKQTVLVLGQGTPARELKAKLTAQGYDVVGTASTAATASKLFTSKQPQVLVLQLSPDRLEMMRTVPALLAQRPCTVVAVSESAGQQMIDAACAAGACGFLIQPVSAEALSAQIQVSFSRFNAFQRLLREKAQIAQDLEARKYVDRAKAILMKRAGLTEPEAHRKLQQESQRRRLSMGEVARRIVESDEMMGGAS